MSGGVQTDEQGMQSAGQQMGNMAETFDGYRTQVNSEVEGLMSTWTGSAAQGFSQAMQQWEASFTQIINGLVDMAEKLGQNSSAYTNIEEDNTKIPQNLAGLLSNSAGGLQGF